MKLKKKKRQLGKVDDVDGELEDVNVVEIQVLVPEQKQIYMVGCGTCTSVLL